MINQKKMKLILAVMNVIVIMIICTSCILANGPVAAKKEIMDVADRVYGDKVTFIKRHKVQKDPDKVEYIYQINGRDIQFKIIAYQDDRDWCAQPRENIRKPAIDSTYYEDIKKYYYNEQESKIKELGIKQEYNVSGEKCDSCIYINKSEELSKVAEYICFLDNLYQFDLNVDETDIFSGSGGVTERIEVDLEESIKGKKEYTSIIWIDFTTDGEGLKYADVYQLLKEKYKEVKRKKM